MPVSPDEMSHRNGRLCSFAPDWSHYAVVTPLRKAASYDYEPRTQCLIGACTSVRVNHFLKSTLNEDEVLNNFDTLYRETIRDIFCIPLILIGTFFSFCFPSYFPVFDTLNAIRAISAGGRGWDLDLNPMQTNRKHCHFVPALCQCTSTSVKLRTGICSRTDQRFSTFLNSRPTLNVGFFFFGPTIPKIGKNYREICRDSNP